MDIQPNFHRLCELHSVAFATVDRDGHPHNRIADLFFCDGEKLYFYTARGKAFYEELMYSGEIAVTGLLDDRKMIRFTGKVQKVSQRVLNHIFQENPYLKKVYPGDSRYICEVFCIYQGSGEVFDFCNKTLTRAPFTFGGATLHGSQYHITDNCRQCRLCAESCPQHCILPGKPYVILQEHCMHCGLCAESCPEEAIRLLTL